MAIIYHDWVAGDDTSGDGSNVNPYKTFIKARNEANDFDEIRVAKTEIKVLSTSVDWTYNSNIIETAASLVGQINIGDFVSKPDGGGNGNEETCYYVDAVTATQITLEIPYVGTTATTASILARTPYDTGINSPVPINKPLTYSGGWDLSTENRDGETWFSAIAPGASNAIMSIGNNCNVSYLNPVFGERGTSVYGVARNITFARGRYSTCRSYAGADIEDCVMMSCVQNNYYTFEILGEVVNIHNNHVFGRTYGVMININNLILDGTNYLYSGSNGITISSKTHTGTWFVENCNSGILINQVGAFISDIYIKNCTTGIRGSGFSSGNIYIYKCFIENCNTGIFLAQSSENTIEECNFENNGIDISGDQYNGVLYAINNDHKTPTNYAYSKHISASAMVIRGCKIDAPSRFKAINMVSNTNMNHSPAYIVENSFGMSGAFYPNGSLALSDSELTPSANPSLQFSYNTTITRAYKDFKIASCYVGANQGKTIRIYYKTDNIAWSGEIIPKIKLSGITVYTHAIIDTVTTNWTLLEIPIIAGIVSNQGELSLEIQVNGNTHSLFFGDFSAEDL